MGQRHTESKLLPFRGIFRGNLGGFQDGNSQVMESVARKLRVECEGVWGHFMPENSE